LPPRRVIEVEEAIMNGSPTPLPVIEIQSPCPADWNAMEGGDENERARFCAHCQRHVHDLSAMRSDEVVDLICRNAGRLCVRFERTADGAVKTLDYAPQRRGWRGRYKWLVVGLLAAMGAGGAKAAWQRQQQPTVMLGSMVQPVRMPPTGPAAAPSGPTCPSE
jgi:hypothetical protein